MPSGAAAALSEYVDIHLSLKENTFHASVQGVFWGKGARAGFDGGSKPRPNLGRNNRYMICTYIKRGRKTVYLIMFSDDA